MAILAPIDDDGTGINASMRQAVMHRGVALDETTQGSGRGFAIVRDLAKVYDGAISSDESPRGGHRVRLTLPAQHVR